MTPFEIALASILFLATVFLAWFFTKRAKFKEKMTMLEKGIKIDNQEDLKKFMNGSLKFSPLKMGIILIGIALGLLVISYLSTLGNVPTPLGLAILLLFTGASFICSGFIGKSKQSGK